MSKDDVAPRGHRVLPEQGSERELTAACRLVSEQLAHASSQRAEELARRLYLPAGRFWLEGLRAHDDRAEPPVFSASGLPGTGKSTLVTGVSKWLEQLHGVRVASFSLDDVYLTRAQRQRLAREVHPLLEIRGVPGTHDVDLAQRTIFELKSASQQSRTALPRFDKVQDDRRPREDWPVFEGRPDLILVEGWCWGAAPGDPARLEQPQNEREAREDDQGKFRLYVHQQLQDLYQDLFSLASRHVHLKAPSHETSVRWRWEQGRADRAQAGLDPDALDQASIAWFLALYERVGRLARQPGVELVIELDEDHGVRSVVRRDS